MEKMRINLGIVLLTMCVLLGLGACSSGGDGEEDESGSRASSWNFLKGKWLGSNGGLAIFMALGDNGSAKAVMYSCPSYSSVETVGFWQGVYYVDSEQNVAKFLWDNNISDELPISRAGNSTDAFHLTVANTTYLMQRQRDDFDGLEVSDNEPAEDYAPDRLTSCELYAHVTSVYYKLYFDRYGDITNQSYCSTFDFKSGYYTKTGTNTARVTVVAGSKANSSTHTSTIDLNFTSEHGGTVKIGVLTGTFTISDYADDISAPYNLTYKTFTPGITGYYFKEKVGNVYICDRVNSPLTYYLINASYARYSDTTARLTIQSKLYKTSDASSDFYDLTFTTSTSGTYRMTTDSRFDTGEQKGTFTLE